MWCTPINGTLRPTARPFATSYSASVFVYHDSTPQKDTAVTPVLPITPQHPRIHIPLVTAINPKSLNPACSLTSHNTSAKFFAWNWPTMVGTIPP
jgi:hypothetical protein